MSFDLSFHIHRLLRKEPFFATFSRKVEKVADKSIPTAAIAFNDKTYRFMLIYNPDFFGSLTDVEKVGVIKHEFYHLILEHLTKRKTFDPKKEPEKWKVWNIAADLAINGHIADELPKMACIPGQAPFEEYYSGCTTEAYFKKLMEDKEQQRGPYEPQEGSGAKGEEGESGPSTMDDHSGWPEAGDGTSISDIASEKLKDMVKEATDKANQSSWGSVPYSMREEIQKIIKVTISPETVLRYFIKTSTKSNRMSTVRRINPRYPYIHPGRKSRKVANIAISIDQAGAVDNGMLQAFFSFLNKFASIATFTVVPFDSTVCEDSIYVWKKGETRKWERVRYGGTNFDAPTQWVNKRNFDGHIIITDMQASKPIASKCQRMWITNSVNKRYQWFQTNEKILAIDG